VTLGNRDRDPRIRHLLPGDAGDSRHAPARHRVPRTPWAAALVGGAAAFTLILVVFGLGGRQPEDTASTTIPELAGDEPVDFTTTTLLRPETLADRLGNDVESVRLATIAPDGSSEILLWHTDSLTPRHYPISTDVPEPDFDASGKFVAYVDDGAIFVQQAGHHLETPLVEGGRGFAWHPTDEARLAFAMTGVAGTDVLVGRASTIAPEVNIVFSVPGRASLVSWGDWGYALAFDESSTIAGGVPGVLILDAAGRPTRAIGGVWLESSGGTTLIEGPSAETAPIWTELLRASSLAPTVVDTPVGLDLVDENLESYGVFAGETSDSLDVMIDDAGDRVAITALTRTSNDGGLLTVGGVSLTILDFNENVPRVIAFRDEVYPIGFVRGGQALAVQSAATGELLIVDTRTGATVRLPIEAGTRILDAWL
jgi:hypothetical protein